MQQKQPKSSEAARERARRWHRENRERALRRMKRYREEHPEKFKGSATKWRRKNPERARAVAKAYREKNAAKIKYYGTEWMRERRTVVCTQLLERQGFKCAICSATEPGGRTWHRDHCHKTKLIRGVLCRACNHGLGHFREDPKLLRAAARYLQRKPTGPVYQ